jgi:hypothetical protein
MTPTAGTATPEDSSIYSLSTNYPYGTNPQPSSTDTATTVTPANSTSPVTDPSDDVTFPVPDYLHADAGLATKAVTEAAANVAQTSPSDSATTIAQSGAPAVTVTPIPLSANNTQKGKQIPKGEVPDFMNGIHAAVAMQQSLAPNPPPHLRPRSWRPWHRRSTRHCRKRSSHIP